MSAYRLYIKTLHDDGVTVWDTGATLPTCSRDNPGGCDPVEFGSLQEVFDYAASRGEVPRETLTVDEVWQIVESGEQPGAINWMWVAAGALVLLALTGKRK